MKKRIEFEIEFTDQQIPEKITWLANEDMQEEVLLKSLFIAGWEEKTKSTATFNIWTNDMRVDEMQYLFIQSLMTLANGFERATGDKTIMNKMKAFVEALPDQTKK